MTYAEAFDPDRTFWTLLHEEPLALAFFGYLAVIAVSWLAAKIIGWMK